MPNSFYQIPRKGTIGYLIPDGQKIRYINLLHDPYKLWAGIILIQQYPEIEDIQWLVEQGDIKHIHENKDQLSFFKDEELGLDDILTKEISYSERDLYLNKEDNYLYDPVIRNWLYRENNKQFELLELWERKEYTR